MSATVFYDGATEFATITIEYRAAGVLVDPTTIPWTVIDPTNTSTTYTYAAAQITKSSAGIYTKDIACTVPGEWILISSPTGTATDVEVVRWTVFDADATLYASPEAVKSRLGDTETVDDQEYRSACGAVSAWIDNYCEDFFGRITQTRTFAPTCSYELEIPSLVSITTLKTDSSGDGTYEQSWTAATHYQLLPLNPSNGRESKPYTKIRAVGSLTFPSSLSYGVRGDLIEIAGVWGWPAIPAPVREAALILAVDALKLKDSPFGVAGFGAEGFAVRVKQNPQALELLAPYRRYPVMVA